MKQPFTAPRAVARASVPILLCSAFLLLIAITHTGLPADTAAAEPLPQSLETAAPSTIDSALAVTEAGKLPLVFAPNIGQTDPSVSFQAHGLGGGTIFFAPAEIVFVLPTPAEAGRNAAQSHGSGRARGVRLRFEGASAPSAISAAEPLTGVVNYLTGDDPARWRTNLPTYGAIVYSGIYPGVDLRYEGATSDLKSTYIVAPGADPGRIRWRWHGTQPARVDVEGNLRLALPLSATGAIEAAVGRDATPPGELVESTPLAWQEIDGQRLPVAVGYSLAPNGSIGFQVGVYDPAYTLVIDPVLAYSTYLGGASYDYGYDIAVDLQGNAYVAGWTQSTDFPTGTTRFDGTYSGSGDGFVTKLNGGGGLVYSTYLGGSGSDAAFAIAVDAGGNAYVTGNTTNSTYFGRFNAYQATNGGARDSFVAKLNATGTGLLYSTYLGGSSDDDGYAIAVDGDGYAYVTGRTRSTNFPTSAARYQGACAGTATTCEDAFVTKLNTAASGSASLAYSSYFGGSSPDEGTGIAVDIAGNVHVAGTTHSGVDFPRLRAIQPACGGTTCWDAFVMKLSVASNSLIYSTYIGGSDREDGAGVAVDGGSAAYVVGTTRSSNFPTSEWAFARTFSGGTEDAFVTKIIWTGTGFARDYSTYLGGSSFDSGKDIAVNAAGNAYVTGDTVSSDFPTFQPTQSNAPNGDAFVTKLSVGGDQLDFSTYLGGGNTDSGNGIAVSGNDSYKIYVTGSTNSVDFPRKAALDGTNSNTDGYVTKITLTAPPSFPSVFGVQMASGNITDTYAVANAQSANVSWTRYHGILWSKVQQTGPTQWNWLAIRAEEEELKKLVDSGFTPIVVVRGVPSWARPLGGLPCGPIASTAYDEFGEFMYRLAERYDGEDSTLPRIQYWEIWNEPDASPDPTKPNRVFGCWGRPSPPGQPEEPFYGGDAFGQMLGEVYPRIKEGSPAARVVLGGLLLDCSGTDPEISCGDPNDTSNPERYHHRFLEGVLQAEDTSGKKTFDIVAYHAYAYRSRHRTDWDLASKWQGGALVGKLRLIRNTLSTFELNRPIIMDEGSLVCHSRTVGCPPTYTLPINFYYDQANYATRLYTRTWARGLIGSTWYYYNGRCPDFYYCGMRGDLKTPEKGHEALKFLANLLEGASYSGQVANGEPLEGYRFKAARGGFYDIYWVNDPVTLTLTLPPDTRFISDTLGSAISRNGNSVQVYFDRPILLDRTPPP